MAAYASKDYLAWLMNPRWGQIPSCGPIICRSRDQDIWVGGRHGEIINHSTKSCDRPCERAFQHVVDPDCAVFPSARKQRRATGIFGPSTCIHAAFMIGLGDCLDDFEGLSLVPRCKFDK